MAQHLLNGAQVHPVREQVGRERMPELVRRDPIRVRQTGRNRRLLDLRRAAWRVRARDPSRTA